MTAEQIRFLSLHARTEDAPTRWRWIFGGAYLRAFTDSGNTATISQSGLAELRRQGLVTPTGVASVRITDAGMQQLMLVAA